MVKSENLMKARHPCLQDSKIELTSQRFFIFSFFSPFIFLQLLRVKPKMSAEDEWGHHEEVSEEPEEGDQPHSPQDFRQLANAHFQNHDFDSALPLYTMALETLVQEQSDRGFTDENDLMESRILHIIFLCNRAACLFRMELYEEAKNDALQAVHVSEGKSAKASFRLAKTHLALQEYLQAIQATEDALQQLQSSQGDEEEEALLLQRKELVKLLEKARVLHLNQQKIPNAETLATVHSIKEEPRKPSIREFDVTEQLGEGNFSRVVAVRHSSKSLVFCIVI
jgi:tetratricopeptide (TPR) repeat protein